MNKEDAPCCRPASLKFTIDHILNLNCVSAKFDSCQSKVQSVPVCGKDFPPRALDRREEDFRSTEINETGMLTSLLNRADIVACNVPYFAC